MHAILDGLEAKLRNGRGDAFKHIETPFGGGKTHTMIAAWHKAKEWGASRVAIVGTTMSADDTVWGMIEKQLTGHIDLMEGLTAPGRDRIRDLLSKHQPLLILIDELLEYSVKAAGCTIGDTTLAGQTVAFVQELAEEVSLLSNVCVVASFPASAKSYEPRGKERDIAEHQLRSLRKVAGRKDHSIAPVSQEDVPNVIRARLFTTPDHEVVENSKCIVSGYADFCHQHKILPLGKTKRQYEEQFSRTYPFTPDVIDTLYGQWGTYDDFQRTRGVLRLLAAVIHCMKDGTKPYITLADFDLSNAAIREELLKYTDRKFESVIRNDITGRTVTEDDTGTRCASTIFMMSFNKDGGRGAATSDIKRAVAAPDGPAVAEVGDALQKMHSRLHYLAVSNSRYKFTQTPNTNRIKDDTEVDESKVDELERQAIRRYAGTEMDVVVYANSSLDVGDEAVLRLVIMQSHDANMIRDVMERRGDNARSFKNGIAVLCPSDAGGLRAVLREDLVVGSVLDTHADIQDSDRRKLKAQQRDARERIHDLVLGAYTVLYVCGVSGPERVRMEQGHRTLSKSVLETLRGADLVHDTIDSEVLSTMYPGQTDADAIYKTMMRAPGSARPTSVGVVRSALPAVRTAEPSGGGAGTDGDMVTQPSTGKPTQPQTGGSDGGTQGPATVTKIVADMSVESGREHDVARLLQDAFKAGFSCRVTVTMEGDGKQHDRSGDLQDLAKDIDPLGTVKHGY